MADFEHPIKHMKREGSGATTYLEDDRGNRTDAHHSFRTTGEVTFIGRTGAGETSYAHRGDKIVKNPDKSDIQKGKLYWSTRKYDDPELEQEWNALEAAIGLYLEGSEKYDILDRLYDLPEGYNGSRGFWHDEVVQVETDPETFRKFFDSLVSDTDYNAKMDYVWGGVVEANHDRIFDHFFDNSNRIRPGSELDNIESSKEVIVTDEGKHLRFTGEANAGVGVPDFNTDNMLEHPENSPLEWVEEGPEGNYELVVSVDVPKEEALDVFEFIKSSQNSN